MPVGFSSTARNLFLLGSTGAQVVTNFFKRIDQLEGTDSLYLPDEIRFDAIDENFLLAGSATDSQSKDFGWFEKRNQGGTSVWDVRIEATTSANTTLRAMELDTNNLVVVGKTGDIPWIAKYTNDGLIDWQSTTNSGDVEYTGITSDSNGNYYACGNTPVSGQAQAFVEKFDGSGNPGWGKSAFMLGRDVVLNKVASNSRAEVVAVGFLEDDSVNKGYIVKIDTNTGEVLWDRTIETYQEDITLGTKNISCEDVYIDSNDQIYVVGNIIGTPYNGFIIKYTAEGNIIWQKETNSTDNIEYLQVKSDGETEQTIVFGRYNDGSSENGILSKYSKNGDLVWRKILYSSFNSSNTLSNVNLDADPSFYYILFTDEEINQLNGTPTSYTFGKVSSSGNGLGNFEYFDGSGESIYYEILNVEDRIGRLSDGSVRQDTSDLITYPFSANKLLFDDLATQVSNKKRQMDSADSFEYSGSPAIRVADFQELNLLGDVYSGSGNWLDQSGKGNNGVVNGATHNAAGYWEFDGVNDRIEIPWNDKFNFGTGEWAIEFWSYNNGGGNGSVISWGDALSDRIDIGPRTGNTAFRFLWDYSGSSPNQYKIDNISTPNAAWYHCVVTRQSNTVRVYIDSVEGGSVSITGSETFPTGTTYGIDLGRRRYADTVDAGDYLNGRIGESRIYPRALTAAQVFQNYNATREKYTGVPASTDPGLTSTRTPA